MGTLSNGGTSLSQRYLYNEMQDSLCSFHPGDVRLEHLVNVSNLISDLKIRTQRTLCYTLPTWSVISSTRLCFCVYGSIINSGRFSHRFLILLLTVCPLLTPSPLKLTANKASTTKYQQRTSILNRSIYRGSALWKDQNSDRMFRVSWLALLYMYMYMYTRARARSRWEPGAAAAL